MSRKVWAAIIVSALGYFVDVYDIQLFIVLRVPSLRALGLSEQAIFDTGLRLLNYQLIGMLVGGFAWGVLGDKLGRIRVLFGSIVLYSLANLANAYVNDVNMYALCRVIAGIGLAGELGAGITLTSELVPTQNRGVATMMVATAGVFGGIAAGLLGSTMPWRHAYIVGALMGLALLVLRVGVYESSLFDELRVRLPMHARGKLMRLVTEPKLRRRFVQMWMIGAPIYLLTGLLTALASDMAAALGVKGLVTSGFAVLYYNMGFGMGDIFSSLLSQTLQSRRKALLFFLALTTLASMLFFLATGLTSANMYMLYLALGIGAGYWAVFLTTSAEQFGTELRATAATSLPNVVRGVVLPFTWLLSWLQGHIGLVLAFALPFALIVLTAMVAAWRLDETFDRDLAFAESTD